MKNLDSAVAKLLSLDPTKTTVASAGGGGMSSASTHRITTTLEDGTQKSYFLKTGSGKDAEVMFRGEHASLTAIHDVVPSLCPNAYGYGRLADTASRAFLVTEFLDLSPRKAGSRTSSMSLAQKMGRLHSQAAPTPAGYEKPMFGFPETTCCGDTPQSNGYKESWADFFAEHRLLFILKFAEARQGGNQKLHRLVTDTVEKIVPRLIGDSHLNAGKGVQPVVVHGDLWSGNAALGRLGGTGDVEHVIFDSSACYAHSEFDLGIMRMFGVGQIKLYGLGTQSVHLLTAICQGFGSSFFNEYHEICPRTEPTEEYDDRIKLYELYHHLNHYALFGASYRAGAISIMTDLIRQYGDGA